MAAPIEVDALIVGAGIVGLATASALAERLQRVVVIERRTSFGLEISSRSSEVIHAGLYYPRDSLKARLCVEGSALVLERCRRLGVPFVQRGKLVVASSSAQEEALGELYSNALACGAKDIELWGTGRLRREEPLLSVSAAVWSPRTAVVDSQELMRSFVVESRERGVELAFRHRLVGLARGRDAWIAEIDGPGATGIEITTSIIVNAAGLGADVVASMAGIDVEDAGYRIHPCKGDYFALRGKACRGLERLLYPLPDPGLQGLGVHLTIDVAGQARLGPDVSFLPSPLPLTPEDHWLDHAVDDRKLADFLNAGMRLLPELTADDLRPDRSGTRPKLSRRGEPPRDFVICHEIDRGRVGLVNLIGIESPGLTAAPSIAGEVVRLLERDGLLS